MEERPARDSDVGYELLWIRVWGLRLNEDSVEWAWILLHQKWAMEEEEHDEDTTEGENEEEARSEEAEEDYDDDGEDGPGANPVMQTTVGDGDSSTHGSIAFGNRRWSTPRRLPIPGSKKPQRAYEKFEGHGEVSNVTPIDLLGLQAPEASRLEPSPGSTDFLLLLGVVLLLLLLGVVLLLVRVLLLRLRTLLASSHGSEAFLQYI